MANRGTFNSKKGASFLFNEGILCRQMDKCSVTLAKNMLNRCNWVLHPKEKRQTVVVRGCGVRVIVDISVC